MSTSSSSTQSRIMGITRVWEPRTPIDHERTLIDQVFESRGLDDSEKSRLFLDASLRGMHDPSLIPDLDKAAERIIQAINLGEKIVIFGDYDVDGITATTILMLTLRKMFPDARVHSYIPHRVDEGYGLNVDAMRSVVDDGANLIVSVDCGITAHEPAQLCEELGVDLIITDHHNPPESMEEMPSAFAIVHPRRPDSKYPFGELCGAGVAYKIAWRVATLQSKSERVHSSMREMLIDMLGFAALGSIADIVPLVDENRVIVKAGLTRIPSLPNEGLQALIRASGLDSEKIDTESVGFRLAPRLNAIGRLGHAREAVELLTEASGDRAIELAERLSLINEERRREEQAIVSQALELAESSGMTSPQSKGILLKHPDWHTGVIGIVCSRLVERYARPVILMQDKDGICKGSGRSIEGFNLHGALQAQSDLLKSFGGHDMAAGLSCTSEHFVALQTQFLAYCDDKLDESDLVHTVKYDACVELHHLNNQVIHQIERMAPFGAGHPRVLIKLKGVQINGSPTPMGKTGQHLSMRIGSIDGQGPMVRVVAWNWAQYSQQIPQGARVEMIVDPKLSTWNGNTRIEPVLVDLRVL